LEKKCVKPLSFDVWRQDRTVKDGKGKALLQVFSWVNDLVATARKKPEETAEVDEADEDDFSDLSVNPNYDGY